MDFSFFCSFLFHAPFLLATETEREREEERERERRNEKSARQRETAREQRETARDSATAAAGPLEVMGRGRRHRVNDSGSLSLPSKWKRVLPFVLVSTLVLDVAVSVLLERKAYVTHREEWNVRDTKILFENFALDLLFLSVLRLLLFPLITWIGTITGSTKGQEKTEGQNQFGESLVLNDTSGGVAAAAAAAASITPADGNHNHHSDLLTQPLLPVLSAADRKKEQKLRNRKCCWSIASFSKNGTYDLDEGLERLQEEKEAAQAMHFLEDVKRANRNKVITESVIFALGTLFQVYAGIKAVSFSMLGFHSKILVPALMIVLVVCVNAESVLCCLIIENYAKEDGIQRDDIHGHPLYFSKANSGHSCDLCRKRILKGYRCWVCDFDVCLKCMSGKTARAEGEGGVRGDKGVRSEKDVTIKPAQYFRRALWLASNEWFLLTCAFGCLMLASTTNLVTPIFSGHVFNSIKDANHDSFYHNIRIFVILSLSSGLFGSCRSLCFRVVSRRLSFLTRNKLFEGIIRQDIAFYDANQTGDLISRMSWDCNAMLQPISNLMGSTLQSIMFFFGGLVMSFVISWRLSMLAFTTMLPIIHLTSKYAIFSQRLNREIFTFIGMANSIAQEAMANIRTVRAFSTEDMELMRYRQETKEALKRGIRDACANAGTIFLSNLIDYGASTLILLYGGLLVMNPDKHKSISIGMLYAYLRFWDMIQTSYQSLQGVMNSFTKAAGAAQRVLSLMDSLPDIDPNSGDLVKSDMSWSVEFENVFFVYQMRPDVVVLKSISLKMESREVCALVGPSGCGKTTIISLILRYYDPTSGRILIGGKELESFNLKALHKQIGYVSQETQMFAKTIEENIAYGCEGNYTQEDLIAACKAANAHDFISGFPSGYQTRIGERGVRLSGGQRQRIAIARMMLRKPKLLLLDEATSALDAESEALVQQSIDNLLECEDHQYTVVLVAHRLSTVVNSNCIYVIDKGVVTERGNHEALMQLQGTYSKLVSRQLEKTANLLYDQ